MPSTTTRPKRSRTSTSLSRRSQGPPPERIEISINVYDLLPPGRLSTVLWAIGSGLLHSGVVIKGREYAYGGHNQRNTTGVYWTKPQFQPPGGTFRISILQGFSFHSDIDSIIQEVSDRFLGTNYNLLTNNCNHFTNALCQRLTNKQAPSWLNRAASIGLALPCVVPKEWIQPPDVDTAEGHLLEEDSLLEGDDGEDEEYSDILASEQRRRQREEQRQDLIDFEDEHEQNSIAGGRRIVAEGTPPPRVVSMRDTSGREMPFAERAPVPKRARSRQGSMS